MIIFTGAPTMTMCWTGNPTDAVGVVATADAGAAKWIGEPHFRQNLADSLFSFRQAAQIIGIFRLLENLM